ncbi:MAG: sugar phosphate isomerase/epimerase family protein [Anaerolineae bacterium]
MLLGIGSYTYTWAIGIPGYPQPEKPLRHTELLERAARLGVQVVQYCDNLPLGDLTTDELTALLRQADALGIGVEVGTRGIDPAHLRAYLRVSARAQSRVLRVVFDTATHRPGVAEAQDTLRPLLPEFAAAGVCLAIENHDRFKAADLAALVERLASPFVGICLDTANSFGALEGPDVVLAALGRHTVNLHVKDFVVRRADHMLGFMVEGAPAGRGQLNVPWLLGELVGLGRDPNAIIELWTPPAPTLAETLAREEAWAAESVAALRPLIPEQG